MKSYKYLVMIGMMALVAFAFTLQAHAMVPSLSVSPFGTDSVSVTVTGDANQNVVFYYNTASGIQNRFIGSTNSNGYFSTTISTNSYGILSGPVYVLVNNQQSVSVAWPFSTTSSLSLSQTNVSLVVGQTFNVTVYNNYSTIYIYSNSNQNVATANISGSNVSIYGNSNGNTNIVVCQSGSSVYCSTIYVTVGGYSNPVNNLGLNLSSLNLSVGNTATVSSVNSLGLYVSSNSNPNVVSVSSTSNYATLRALSAGTSAVVLCQGSYSGNCSTVTVSVTSSTTYYSPTTQYYPPADTFPTVAGASVDTACSFYRTLRLYMSGNDVYCLQSLLYARGYLTDPNSLNSYFDTTTRNAVIRFQQNNYLRADGIVGPQTQSRLY